MGLEIASIRGTLDEITEQLTAIVIEIKRLNENYEYIYQLKDLKQSSKKVIK